MELQESTVRNVHAFLGFERTPTFLDVRGRLVERLMPRLELDDWRFEPETGVGLFRESPAVLVGIDDDRALLSIDDPPDLGTFQAMIETWSGVALETLDVEEVTFIGAGATGVAPADSFVDLTRWLSDRLGPDPRLQSAFGDKPTKAWWQFAWEHEQRAYSLEVGPTTSDAERVEGDFLDPEALELPATFLLMDVRRSLAGQELARAGVASACVGALTDAWNALNRFEQGLRADVA
jgi:hypothetical protein